MRKLDAKMANRKKVTSGPKKDVDSLSPKRPPGRPGIHRSRVRNNADHYRMLLGKHWKVVGEPLLQANTPEEVTAAFRAVPEIQRVHFVPSLAKLILQVRREPHFPKTRNAQIGFLADSLGARGKRSPRRSRDICVEERKNVVHWIIRREFYIECTCGYKGPALRGACPKCKTDMVHSSAVGFEGSELI